MPTWPMPFLFMQEAEEQKSITDALNLVQAVTGVVEFKAEEFIPGICIPEICRARECLHVLE
jgi:hypothetical protein